MRILNTVLNSQHQASQLPTLPHLTISHSTVSQHLRYAEPSGVQRPYTPSPLINILSYSAFKFRGLVRIVVLRGSEVSTNAYLGVSEVSGYILRAVSGVRYGKGHLVWMGWWWQ